MTPMSAREVLETDVPLGVLMQARLAAAGPGRRPAAGAVDAGATPSGAVDGRPAPPRRRWPAPTSGAGHRRMVRRGGSSGGRALPGGRAARAGGPGRRVGLGLGRRRARVGAATGGQRGRGAAAAGVGAVEAGALEDDTDGAEHLAQATLALRAGGQRVVAEGLHGLEAVVA